MKWKNVLRGFLKQLLSEPIDEFMRLLGKIFKNTPRKILKWSLENIPKKSLEKFQNHSLGQFLKESRDLVLKKSPESLLNVALKKFLDDFNSSIFFFEKNHRRFSKGYSWRNLYTNFWRNCLKTFRKKRRNFCNF